MPMSELRDLYQDVILDHGRRPRNFGRVAEANREARGYNPLCGDRLELSLRVEDGVVCDVKFKGAGCAISTASASLMTQAVKGRSAEEVERLFAGFRAMVTRDDAPPGDDLGKLEVFAGVREYPARVKCATLAWHTLRAALASGDEDAGTVSTE